jgi:hypothetical protein
MILFRIILTVLLFPLEIIFCGLITKLIWFGEEERQAARQQAKTDLWLREHPIEAARIQAERERRAALQRTQHLAAEKAKRIAAVAEAAAKKKMIETALATPLPEAQAQLLAEMPLNPPRLKDLRSLAKGSPLSAHRIK